MIKTVTIWLESITRRSWYWWTFITGCLLALAIALYHQHGLDELPCLLCIQVRLLVSLLLLVAIPGLILRLRPIYNMATHLIIMFTAGALVERSYMLLGTERGFVFADCGFDLGLPAWFAIEEWLPWLFRVETTCGYTPVIAFNITMAEALMVLSVALLLFSFTVFLTQVIQLKSANRG